MSAFKHLFFFPGSSLTYNSQKSFPNSFLKNVLGKQDFSTEKESEATKQPHRDYCRPTCSRFPSFWHISPDLLFNRRILNQKCERLPESTITFQPSVIGTRSTHPDESMVAADRKRTSLDPCGVIDLTSDRESDDETSKNSIPLREIACISVHSSPRSSHN